MESQAYDVVVVGSGAAGAMAALRARELGLSVLIIEKAHKYGGTSATSGGVLWIPNHGLTQNGDSREQALRIPESSGLRQHPARSAGGVRRSGTGDGALHAVAGHRRDGGDMAGLLPRRPGRAGGSFHHLPDFRRAAARRALHTDARAIYALQVAQSLCDGPRGILCLVRASQGLAPRAHEDFVALLDRLRHTPHQPARSKVYLGRSPHGSDLQANLRARHRGAARNEAERAASSPTAKSPASESQLRPVL
jgi:glycine/D-amino acid oxidase-like deaminating enzyme